MKYLLLFSLLFFVPIKSQAQWLDPDNCWTCKDSREHFVAGVGIDLGLQILPHSWAITNKPWKRVVLITLAGAIFELGQADVARDQHLLGKRGFGFGLKDETCNIAGAIVSEFFTWGIRKII